MYRGVLANIFPRSVGPFTFALRGHKVSADELRTGMMVEHDGRKMIVVSHKAAMMGRRPTSLHIELRDTTSGKVYPVRFSPADRVERIVLDNFPYTLLYFEGDVAFVMHPETFEQLEVDASLFGVARHYIPNDSTVEISFYQGNIYSVNIPDYANIEVKDTEFVDSSRPQPNDREDKPATLVNGRVIKVPRAINAGDIIRIRLSDETFHQRVNE